MKPVVPKPQRCAIYTRKSTEHNLECLTQGKVFELQSFQNQVPEPPQLPPSNEFERLYETAKRDADLAKVLEPHDEDRPLGDLLTSALDLFVMQTALPKDVDLTADAETSRRPPLNGRLTFSPITVKAIVNVITAFASFLQPMRSRFRFG